MKPQTKILKNDILIPAGTPFDFVEDSTVDNYNGRYEAVVDGVRVFVDETEVEDEVEREPLTDEEYSALLSKVSAMVAENLAIRCGLSIQELVDRFNETGTFEKTAEEIDAEEARCRALLKSIKES